MADAAWISFVATSGGITHLREDDRYLKRSVVFLNRTEHLGEGYAPSREAALPSRRNEPALPSLLPRRPIRMSRAPPQPSARLPLV